MKITQKLELTENERIAIAGVIDMCEELSKKTHRSVIDIFDFFYGQARTSNNMVDAEIDLSEMD